MNIRTSFDTCRSRGDVLRGPVAEADFAADLAQVVAGDGSPEYVDPVRFFANTYPTRGLKNLLANVCRGLSGAGGEAAAIFRLDTSYGGGKTHGLIALAHAARGLPRVAGVDEFIDASLLPRGSVRLAAFDGENADSANGRTMGEGVRAHTRWGGLAYALAGAAGYDRVGNSDTGGVATGADTLRELFGGESTLILLDEFSVYLRKVQQSGAARDQLTAFLTSLFRAVEGTPRAALVYPLAIGKEGRAVDAYSVENQFIADRMAEAESVSAREATLLNPTEEDETAQVLRRRLFEFIDDAAARDAVAAYQAVWSAKREAIAADAPRPETGEAFRASYPLHPEVLQTLTSKTATLDTFQRVRGMLRLLTRTIAHLWESRLADATAIHLHHVDPGCESVPQEIVTRLQQSAYVPAIANDVAGAGGARALAEEIDAKHHGGLPPYAAYVARTIFMYTLAFNELLKGLSPEKLRYSMLGPTSEVSFIEEARKKFVQESAYLDDRLGAPMRFLVGAKLTQIIRREEKNVDSGEAPAELNDRIGQIFRGGSFDAIPFPGGPFDVPDDVGNGRPKLVALAYDTVSIGAAEDVPEIVRRIYLPRGSDLRRGSDGSVLRLLRNNVVFVVADDARKAEMRRHAARRLALRELRKAERIVHLAEHQRDKVCELEARSEQEFALAIQQCYRHVFYPSRHRVESADVDLAHSAIDIHSTSDQLGAGQQHVVRALADLNKLRYPEDEPDSPAYVRDRTPLKGKITTAALRNEFRHDPGLPMLVGDDVFVRGVRLGVEQGEYVYRRSDLLLGPGDPFAEIAIDEQSVVFTMAFAKNRGIWPRRAPDEPEPDPPVLPGPDPPVPPGPDLLVSPPPPGALTAEGVLRDALTQICEQARGRGIDRVGMLTIRMFEASDAFRLLGRVGALQRAEKVVTFAGGARDRRRRLVPDRVPRAGDRRPARAGVPRTAAVARRERPKPGGELRAVVRRRPADGRRRGRDLYRTSVPVLGRGRLPVGDGARGRIVMARLERLTSVETPASAPRYELRLRWRGPAQRRVRHLATARRRPAPCRRADPRGRPRGPQPGARRAPRAEAPRPRRRHTRLGRPPRDPRLRPHGGPRPDFRLVPRTRPAAQPRQHAAGGRRHRGDGPQRGSLLARHDHAPAPPAPRADRVEHPS